MAAIAALLLGFAAPVRAQFTQVLFTDNFYSGLTSTPASSSTDLNLNIGLSGGRQGGSLVTANPSGYTWSMYGKTSFTTGNGWDLRGQDGFPVSGPVDPWTLRYRDNVAGEWSTVSPDLNFSSSIIDNSYRIQALFVHAHLDTVAANDRWIGLTFGANSVPARFVNVVDAAGVILFASGAYQIWSDSALIGFGAVPLTPNGAFTIDLRVLNNTGSLFINGNEVNTGLDFSGVLPEWVGFTMVSGTANPPSALTQFRVDDLIVSTIPEPSAFALGGLGLAMLAVLRRRRG